MQTKTKPRFNYTQNAWEGSKYKKNEHLYGASLTKAIRQEIKKTLPNCKFSITSQTYSGGQSINVYLMSADFNPFNPLTEEIKKKIKLNTINHFPNNWESVYETTIENYKKTTTKDLHKDINYFYIDEEISLTDKAKEIMTKALRIAQSYNYDDSDAMTDYFSTNFYLHAGIGKWDKPFIINK